MKHNLLVYPRNIEQILPELFKQYPIITVTGPRQSGKTTICRQVFQDKIWVNLEDLEQREFASSDPKGFLARYPEGAFLDEIQRVPALLSYLQVIVDEKSKNGMFVLSGSQQFDLMENIAQSLAGRTAIIKLLPCSYNEVYGNLGNRPDLEDAMYRGFYPRVLAEKQNPTQAYSYYTSTYIERDVRRLLNVHDLERFATFIRLCAGRTGQLLDLTDLGNNCGINSNTARSWLAVLEASYIVTLVKPYYRNINKRLIKTPKLYFFDVGLAAYLAGIQSMEQIITHPLRGALFETMVVVELIKSRFNQGLDSNLFYLRDSAGHEIDLIIEDTRGLVPIEIKSGKTITTDFFKGFHYYKNIMPELQTPVLIYGGEAEYIRENVMVRNWRNCATPLLGNQAM